VIETHVRQHLLPTGDFVVLRTVSMPQKEEAAHAFAVAATLSLGLSSEALQFCLKIDKPDTPAVTAAA
jgi:hypothetical protein